MMNSSRLMVKQINSDEITPGITSNTLTVVEKGLEPGELVVVDGLDRLRDGIAVKVAATTETPKAQIAE